MFYRISFILGTILSLFFVLLCGYILFIEQNIASEGRSVSALYMITNSFFLLINFICLKIDKCNVEHRLIPGKLKKSGKLIFLFTIISIVIVLFSGIAGLVLRLSSDKVLPEKQTFFFHLIIILLLLSGILAIINLLYFRKVSGNNKKITNQLIDDIQLT